MPVVTMVAPGATTRWSGKAYAKLGISSRAELGRLDLDDGGSR